jgi:hypothetical protein
MDENEKRKRFMVFLEEIMKKSYVYPYLGVNAFDKKVEVEINYGSDDCFISASTLLGEELSYRIQIGVRGALKVALESECGPEDFRRLKNGFLGRFYHEGAHLLWTYFGILTKGLAAAKRDFCLAGANILEDLFIETLAIERVEKFKLSHEKNFLEEAFREMRAFYFGELKYKSTVLGKDPVEINNSVDFLNWVLCYIRGARPPKNKFFEVYLPLLRETLAAFWKEGNNKKRGKIAVDFFAKVWEALCDSLGSGSCSSGIPGPLKCDVKAANEYFPAEKTPAPRKALPDQPVEESGQPGEESDQPGEESGQPGEESGQPGEESGQPGEESDQPGEDSDQPGEESGQPGEESGQPGEESGDESQGDAKSGSDESEEGLLAKEISTVEGLCSSLGSSFELFLHGSETVHLLEELTPLPQSTLDYFEKNAMEAKEKVSLYIEEIKDKFQELIMEKKSRMVGGNPFGKLNVDSYMKNPGIVNSLKWFDTKRGSDYKQDLVMTLLVDFSGSMGGNRTEMANQSVILLDEVCTFLGIPLQIEYFSTVEFDAFKDRECFSQATTLITREFDDRTVAKIYPTVRGEVDFFFGKKKFMAFGNSDPFNVAGALNRLRERKEEKKILVVLSDGNPYYDDVVGRTARYCGMVNGLFKEIVREEKEILVYGIGIETDAVKAYYPNYFMVRNAAALVDCVDDLIKKILFV